MPGQKHGAIGAGFLSTVAFAAVVGIGRGKASEALRTCYLGGTWRGTRLEVRTNHGRGGVAGARYEVAFASIPERFRKVSATDPAFPRESVEIQRQPDLLHTADTCSAECRAVPAASGASHAASPEWCLLLMRPDKGGRNGTAPALGRWLDRGFKVSSMHFVTAEVAAELPAIIRGIKEARPAPRAMRRKVARNPA